MSDHPESSAYQAVFEAHRGPKFKQPRAWQSQIFTDYADVEVGDVAIEAPTGSGKTLAALIIAEEFRAREERPVAYLTGTKQLARQVEREAQSLSLPVARFQGDKTRWSRADLRDYTWGRKIAILNYWAYINERPGLDPAALLILDDVHLAESPLRGYFTLELPRAHALYEALLEQIVGLFPYYALAADLLDGGFPPAPPEMLTLVDSAELAATVTPLFEKHLVEDTQPWWAWRHLRGRAEICCWLISARAITLTPFVPVAQEIPHFSEPERRLYLSATVGSVDDVQRRLGCKPFKKLVASAAPSQGERYVIVDPRTDQRTPGQLAAELAEELPDEKVLWLCARSATADSLISALEDEPEAGDVLRLQEDNGCDETFARADPPAQLVTAGRYDGMDFPGDACRVEVLPEAPVAINDLEEFISNYLRDATFADARFAQRLAQALGRCNRLDDDRAVYLLLAAEFHARLARPRVLAHLPKEVRADIAAGLERDAELKKIYADARAFLTGETFTSGTPPKAMPKRLPDTAAAEVDAYRLLWNEDYESAASAAQRVVDRLPTDRREYCAFWLGVKALALHLASESFADPAARVASLQALRKAASTGGANSFFARMRATLARLEGRAFESDPSYDRVFEAWDGLIDDLGDRVDVWAEHLLADLTGKNHDAVARAIGEVGQRLLGIEAFTPQPTDGESDAVWRLARPPRELLFEVKLAPKAQRITKSDVDQAEGAVRAAELGTSSSAARGLIVTPYPSLDRTALSHLDRVKVIDCDILAAEVKTLLASLRSYRIGWTRQTQIREQRRAAVEGDLPPIDWLWRAHETASGLIEATDLRRARKKARVVA